MNINVQYKETKSVIFFNKINLKRGITHNFKPDGIKHTY